MTVNKEVCVLVPKTPIGYVPVTGTGIWHKFCCESRHEAYSKMKCALGLTKKQLHDRGYYVAPVYANIHPPTLPAVFNKKIIA